MPADGVATHEIALSFHPPCDWLSSAPGNRLGSIEGARAHTILNPFHTPAGARIRLFRVVEYGVCAGGGL